MVRLAEIIEGIRVNATISSRRWNDLVKPLTVDLDDHARREEEFLFPRLAQRVPDSPVPVMIAEHAEIRDRSAAFRRWYPLWREGDESVCKAWAEAVSDSRGKFSTHMQKETLILFPLAKRVFTAPEIQEWMALDDW